jgi:hypothetical protein
VQSHGLTTLNKSESIPVTQQMTPINPNESSTHQISSSDCTTIPGDMQSNEQTYYEIVGTPTRLLSDCMKIDMLQRWANIYIPYEPQPIWGDYTPSRSSCKWCATSDDDFEQQVLDSSGEESFIDLWFECFGQTISKDSIKALHEMCREEEAERKAKLEEVPFGNFRLNRYRQTISKDFIQALHERCGRGVHIRQYDINLDIDDDTNQPTSSPELVVEQQDTVPTQFDQCVADNELLSKYSEEQQKDLCGYAQMYELTIAEAIEYQTSCHNCGKEVKNGQFDDVTHQYCGKRCFKYSEDFYYPCFREGNCLVCSRWQ